MHKPCPDAGRAVEGDGRNRYTESFAKDPVDDGEKYLRFRVGVNHGKRKGGLFAVSGRGGAGNEV